MPVKLDLQGQTKKDKEKATVKESSRTEGKKSVRSKSSNSSNPAVAKVNSATKRGQGRPKGGPCVTRSLRIREDVNVRFVAQHEETKMSYNDIVNEALDAYLK